MNIIKRIKKKNPKIAVTALFDNLLPHEPKMVDEWLISSFLFELDKQIVQSAIVKEEILSVKPDADVLQLFHPVFNQYGVPIDRDKARGELGIRTDFLILYFGLVRKYKGLDDLINAAFELKKLRSDFQVLAIGEAYDSAEDYLDLIQSQGVQDIFSWKNEFISDDKIK